MLQCTNTCRLLEPSNIQPTSYMKFRPLIQPTKLNRSPMVIRYQEQSYRVKSKRNIELISITVIYLKFRCNTYLIGNGNCQYCGDGNSANAKLFGRSAAEPYDKMNIIIESFSNDLTNLSLNSSTLLQILHEFGDRWIPISMKSFSY